MYITVGRKDIVIGPKGRLAFSTVVVLLMHLLMLWGFIQMRPRIYTFHYSDTEAPLEVELYQVKEPPPEPVPVVKLDPHQIVLPRVEPKPQPQQQAAAPAPAAQSIPAPPSPAPDPAIKARAIEQIDLQQQQVKSFSQTVVANNADMPTLAPAPSLNKLKQRKDEEAGLVKPVAGVTGLSSLNLHAVPDTAPSLEADVAPSGLPAPSGGGKPAVRPPAVAARRRAWPGAGHDRQGHERAWQPDPGDAEPRLLRRGPHQGPDAAAATAR